MVLHGGSMDDSLDDWTDEYGAGASISPLLVACSRQNGICLLHNACHQLRATGFLLLYLLLACLVRRSVPAM